MTSKMVAHYVVKQRIGVGSFASVYRGFNRRTGEEVAIKMVSRERLNQKLAESLESEIAILKLLQHENIVALKDIQKTDRHFYLILEYCSGGDLLKYIKRHGALPEETVQYFLRQLACGLQFLRAHNLIHRDLKPQNLLLTSNNDDAILKIADFGFARHIQPQGLAETLCGSPLYMAPEILLSQKYDAKADLWSVGTILFEMLTGRPPFTGNNHIHLLENIEKQELRFPENIRISPECVHLLKSLLKRNPVERLSFEEFFAHPFVDLAHAAAAAAAAPSQPIDISTAARERRSSSVSSTSPPLAVTASIIGTPPHTANTPTATHNKPAAASAASGAVQPSHTSMAMAGAPPASSSSTSPTSAVAPAAVGGIGGMGGIGGTAVVPQSPRDMSTAVPQVERKSSDLGIARLYSDKSLGSKQLSSERGSISGSGSFSGSKTPQPPKTNPFKSSITSNDRSANEILDLEPGESDSQTDKEYVLVTNPVASLLLTPGDAKIAQDVYMEAMAQRAVAVADFADSKLEGGRVLEAYALLLKALDLFHRAMAMTPSVTDASPKLQEIYDSCRHRFVISLSKTEKLKSQVENAHKTIGQNNTVSAEKLLYDFAFQLGRDAALDEWWGDLSRAQHRCQQAIAMLEVLLLEKGMGETDKRVLKEYLAAFVARMEEMRRKSISPSRQQG